MGDVQIAAREPDISEHVIVQIREAREFPAMFDAYDEPPRQHRVNTAALLPIQEDRPIDGNSSIKALVLFGISGSMPASHWSGLRASAHLGPGGLCGDRLFVLHA
jgi:hypothetical protein